MNTLASYAFSSLALSAKLHRLLDTLGRKKAGFDNELEQALEVLDADSPLRDEARLQILLRAKKEFSRLENQYQQLLKENKVPVTALESFEELLENIRQQIKEKEIML